MVVERKVLPFEPMTEEGKGEFEGYANCANNLDGVGDIVGVGAFQKSLPEFLASRFIGGINHNHDNPIGRPLEAREDAKGLWIRAMLSDTVAGRDCRTLMQDGVIKFLSIGFIDVKARLLRDQAEVYAYWQSVRYTPSADERERAKRGARLIHSAKLIEVSPVTLPANSLAEITGVKSMQREIASERDFERFLREAGGFSRRKATAITLHGFKTALPTEEETPLSEGQALYLQFLLGEARRLGVRVSEEEK